MKKAIIYYLSAEEKTPVKWKEIQGLDLRINIFEKQIGLYEGPDKLIFVGPLESFAVLLEGK